MKKLVFFFFTLFLLIFVGLFSAAAAQATDLLPYFCPPGEQSVHISSGEDFWCQPSSGGFTICKNTECSGYEKFTYDGNHIYHHEDTTWATATGPVFCSDGNQAYYNLLNEACGTFRNTCGCWPSDKAGMPWVHRDMSVGSTLTAEGTVVGFNMNTGECCNTPYTGPFTHAMNFAYQGCILFPTGIVCDDGIKLVSGAGEEFYYCQGYGWVGFNRGISGTGNYVVDDLGSSLSIDEAKDSCLVITIGLNTLPGINFDCRKKSSDVDSRPNECELCQQTGFFCTACATDFQVSDEIKYKKGEHYGENACLSKPWGGNIVIDPSAVSIPFVGHEGGEDEQNYLADYFEGTFAVYPDRIKEYSTYWLDWVNHAGVFPKLTPMTYQNQLKKQMINRAINSESNPGQEGSIHDYQLQYAGRLCWDFPLAIDVFIALLGRLGLPELPEAIRLKIRDRAHSCLFANSGEQEALYLGLYSQVQNFNNLLPNFLKISVSYKRGVGIWLANYYLSELQGNTPPNPNQENYAEEWQEWKEKGLSKWFKLWQVVPMFSREDTPGLVSVQVGTKEGDRYDANPRTSIEKVPHVARLHEASYQTQKMLLPYWPKANIGSSYTTSLDQVKQSQSQSGLIIAQPSTRCPQTGPLPIPQCEEMAISDPNPNDTLCCENTSINLQANEIFTNPYWPSCELEGECKKVWNYDLKPSCGEFDCGQAETKAICNNQWWDECCTWKDSCDDEVTKSVSRRVGITLRHPYLTTIWEQTSNPETQGVFNIFRPAEIPPFPDMDAQSSEKVDYSYSSGSVGPSKGDFYFNHLGGIQLAKDWVVGTLGHTAKAIRPGEPDEDCGPPGPAPESCPKDDKFEPPVTGLCCDYGKHTGNPYYIDVGDSKCSSDYCHKESFGPCNMPFGECYYCNTNVCKRNDGVGGCAAICNWQCCQ